MLLKFFSIFHNMPLWVFSWAAISFSIFWYYSDIVPSIIQPYVPLLAILSIVGAICKAMSVLYSKYFKKPEPVKTFHLTQNQNVDPAITKFPSGNLQMNVRFLTNVPIELVAARVIKPRRIRINCKQVSLVPSKSLKDYSVTLHIGGNVQLNKKDVPAKLAISDLAGNEQVMDVVFKVKN